MSIEVAYHLVCDGDRGNCGAVFDISLVPGLTGTEQRREARSHGWKVGRRGGKDLCPSCAGPIDLRFGTDTNPTEEG